MNDHSQRLSHPCDAPKGPTIGDRQQRRVEQGLKAGGGLHAWGSTITGGNEPVKIPAANWQAPI